MIKWFQISDYRIILEEMIYGETKDFRKLMGRVAEIQQRFRAM